MSMSNLASQLAGLNNNNKNVGSILGASTRHDDATGRGFQHSVQVGHSIASTDPRFKPSLLYEDAKAASDVPLSTLWENCEAALLELSDLYPPLSAYQRVCQEALLQRTPKEKAPKTSLTQLLTILSTLIPHDSPNCLHVLEYLVRRYNIHMSAADPLLLCLLPHAEAHPQLFHRLLQLVNIAGSHQHSWIWLRPYASTSGAIIPPPRHVVVQNVVPNTALLQQVCTMTRNIARLVTDESKPHRGMRQILSWSATLMVQGLYHLQKVELSTGNKESVLRVLLPFCTAACSSTTICTDWTAWGQVVASSLAETMELAPPVKQCLCLAIMKGVQQDDTMAVADALVAVASVCLPVNEDNTWNATSETWKDCLTVPFANVLQKIWQLGEEVLATALHHIYHEREMDVSGVVTSLLIWTVLHPTKHAGDQIINALMKDEELWKNETLTEPFAEWLVWTYSTDSNDDDKQSKRKVALYKQLLGALRRMDAVACERGMARAMMEEGLDKKRLAALLEGVLPAASKPSSKDDKKNTTSRSWLPPRVALEHADPALRLQAIEQLMEEYRTTIQNDNDEDEEMVDVRDEERLETLQEGLSRRMASDEDAPVVLAAATALKETLENNKAVRLELSDILATLYQWTSFSTSSSKKKHKKKKKKKSPTKDKDSDKDDTKESAINETQQSIITACLEILGHTYAEDGDKEGVLVLEALAAHLEHWNDDVATAAATSLVKVMDDETLPASKTEIMNQAKNMLVVEGTDFCANLVSESATRTKGNESSQATEASLRRRSLWVMLTAMKEWLAKANKDDEGTTRISKTAVDACMVILSTSTEKDWHKNPERAQSLKDTWQVAVKSLAPVVIPEVLVSLASLPKEKVYQSLGKELIETLAVDVKDINDNDVSVYSVLMEAALQDSLSDAGVVRLLTLVQDQLASGSGKNTAEPASWCCLVPALALLEHSNESVRLAAIRLLGLLKKNGAKQPKDAPYKSLVSLCQEVLKKESSATLGGLAFLPSCLVAAVQNSGDALKDDLLSLCFSAAVGCGSKVVSSKSQEKVDNAWLPFGQAAGQIGACVAVLRSMELAGEASFPLKQRWDEFGGPILAELLRTESDGASSMASGVPLLCDTIVGMLKGVAVSDSRSLDTVVISMGPSSTGRRQRSYSIGRAEGVTYVEQYPTKMVDSIIKILECSHNEANQTAHTLCKALASKVLGRESWAEYFFSIFSGAQKRKIATEFLLILADSPLQISVSHFLTLPLDASDITFMRKNCTEKPSELAAVSILADYVRSNDEMLMSSSGAAHLVKTLFASLAAFSSATRDDGDEAEFVRQAILSALIDLLSKSQRLNMTDKEVGSFVDLLLSLNSNDVGAKDCRPLVSQRAKSTSLSLLTKLCARFPKPVVASLIPAIKAHIEATETVAAEENMAEQTLNTFASIVPVFWKFASQAGLSLSHLLNACVESTRSVTSHKKREGIYSSLVRALASCSSSGPDEPSMGAIVAAYFAGEVHAAGDDFKAELRASAEFALQIMYEASGFAQVSSILLLLHYADSLLLTLSGDKEASTTSFDSADSNLPTAEDLVQMALTGSPAAKSKKKSPAAKRTGTTMDLVRALLLTANDAMFMESVRKCIRRSDRSHTALCLRLWQDLLILQSTASDTASNLDDDSDFAETIVRISGESLELIQSLMPLPIFLASATSLIKEGGTDDLRAGAIRLVADRAPELRPGTPEVSLFLEMASLLVGFLKSPQTASASDENGYFLLQQSALVAIEHIARASGEGHTREKATKNQDRIFLSALQGCANLFVSICGPANKLKVEYRDLDDSSRKLLCSASLCMATLVRATAPKCIALLPKFMHQLVSSLCSVNSFVLSTKDDQLEILADARMTQVCLLRALASVAESVPQFIYPYLKNLLASSALPSEAMRGPNVEQSVRSAAEGLEESLSKHVPVRVLLPVVSTAIAGLERPTEFVVLLKLLKQSIDASSGEELVGHLGALLKAATTAYDYDCEHDVRVALVEVANEAVLALVMKLSENHLRRLYSKLREWRGAMDAEDPERSALRRYAFWKVSAVLSKELRTIFLPCLSSVLKDATDELNLVVSHFCAPKKSETTKDGKKKRRLDDDASGQTLLTPNSMLSIQPLLLCLELSMRADAQDGGKWIRVDDGQRYRSLLEPLGLLLQSKVPTDYRCIDEGSSPFQCFVQGGADAAQEPGSVLGCVAALASAAGNEQLWKPLNYAVLDACGNRGRSEVRKAGLACLLSLMKSLGEEYMVLLPECLPVLSELLEDHDEEVAGLAQDCISLGEELLGESLEDSLR